MQRGKTAQAPLAALGGLLTLPRGATTFKAAQILGRNYALVLPMAFMGVLFWPTSQMMKKRFIRLSPTARTKFRPVYTAIRPPTPR